MRESEAVGIKVEIGMNEAGWGWSGWAQGTEGGKGDGKIVVEMGVGVSG